MIVYHGSTQVIDHPDIKHSKKYLDFGQGFYVTIYEEQAKNWAIRKALRQSLKPIVNVYELDDDLNGLNILKFEEDEKWLKFVCECREGKDIYKNYDIIIGNVADDKVFRVIEMYFKGMWDVKRTLEELHYYKLNNLICIINQEVLDKKIKFVKSYEVKND